MDEKTIYGLFTSIIGILFTLVISLITKINKGQEATSTKLNEELSDVKIKVELVLERIGANIDNVNEIKESITKFREDLSTLQLDNREFKQFKILIEKRLDNIENKINNGKL